MRKSYSEKLRDPRWQKLRLKILERDEWACALCEGCDVTLHVHHKLYRAGADPWDYPENELVTLCHDCHETVEAMKSEIGSMLHFAPFLEYFDLCKCLLGAGNHFTDACAILSYLSSNKRAFDRVLWDAQEAVEYKKAARP